MVKTYRRIMGRLALAGVKPKKHILDNEISLEFKKAIVEQEVDYELVPKGQHRRNIAEKAIQTWKSHAIGALSGIGERCPLYLWDTMLPHLDRQVNMLRMSNVAPKVSAYAHLYGPHDFNRHPWAPLGIAVHVYIPPDKRRSWSVKSKKGHYIGMSTEHYRYYLVDVTETKQIQGSETVFFKHKYITMPDVTPADAIVEAARQLSATLQGRAPSFLIPTETDQIRQLSNIFSSAASANAARTDSPQDRPRGNAVAEDNAEADAPPPRVEEVVEAAPPPRVEEEDPARLIVASNGACSAEPPILLPMYSRATPLPDWVEELASRKGAPHCITQDDDGPAQNTRQRHRKQSITDEVLLHTIEMSTSRIDPRQAASGKYPMQLLCEMAGAVLDSKTGELLEYRHLIKRPEYQEVWGAGFGKEIGRLAQGLPGVKDGTNTIDFITKEDVPADRFKDTTYARIVCNYRPEKEDPNRVRITVGGNKINYPGDCGTRTADLLTVKLLLNSVISTPGAKFKTMDIANFYLKTPLKRKEYLKMKLAGFPANVVEHYSLNEKATKDGWVYVAIKRGMYGLPQSGILAQELLEERLNLHGYHQSLYTPGLWTHESRPICFSLVVDNFGVKYVGEEHCDHLLAVLKEHYDVKVDETGGRYLGLTIDWDYAKRCVHLSMPDYVPDALHRFKRTRPTKLQHQPHPHVPPNYGAKTQYATNEVDAPEVSAEEKTYIQQVLGTFLYYARAVDCTMLVALGSIATEQAKPTKKTLEKVDQLLDYAASQETAVLTFHASDMVLAIHSDALYLSESKARSRAGGHFFLSSDVEFPSNNGAVLTVAQIIKAVMASAAEAEIGAMYINAREAVPARKTLEELGHPQPRTPMQTDNTAAHAVVSNNVQPKRTKAMDQRFHWLRCRRAQKQFRYYWRPGNYMWEDYVTKHHPSSHHKNMRPEYLTPHRVVDELRRKQKRAKLSVELAQSILDVCTYRTTAHRYLKLARYM
jgi:hypothetical protein